MTVASYAAEEPAGNAPEEISADQIATEEMGSEPVEGPEMSPQELASESRLDALPEVADEGDIGVQRCDNPYKKWYSLSGRKENYHIPSRWNGTSYKDGPGGTITVEVVKSGKIGIELSGNVSAEAGVLLAKAKTEFGAKVLGEIGISTGHRYSRNIRNGYYGNVQYGTWGEKYNWTKYETSANRCGKKKLGSGTTKMPTKKVGWRYWETRS